MLDLFNSSAVLPSAHDPAWILISAVLMASFLGSPHCVGMCGPLAATVSRTGVQNLFYNLGRGLSYGLLGLSFGWLGATLFEDTPLWLRYGSTALMVVLVLWVSWRIAVRRPLHMWLPQLFTQALQRVWPRLARQQEWPASFLSGVLTIGLPCGWLYTFVALAGAAGSPVRGLLVMMAFWLGTVPVMAVVPASFGHVLLKVQHRFPRTAGLLVACSSLFVIWSKWMSVASDCGCH